MPANSGAITETVDHNHSAPSAEGGFLLANTTGMTGTANGSLLVADGSSVLQNLPTGNLNDVLTMGAATPSWQAAGCGGGSVWELIDFTQAVANTTTIDTTFANIPGDDMTELYCISTGCNGGNTIDMQIYDEGTNLLTGAFYTNHGYTIISGTQTLINTSGQTAWNAVPGSFEPHQIVFHLSLGRCGGSGNPYFPRVQSFAVGTNGVSHIGGVYSDSPKATGIAGVKFGVSGSNSIENGTTLSIYQLKNA